MPSKQLQLHCGTCNAVMPHTQNTPNHVVHALLSLFTAGLWLVIWIIVAIAGNNDAAACGKCGNKRKAS